jgi:WD40 repeat protein
MCRLFLPVYVSSLPDSIEIEDWDSFNRQYQTYLKNTTESQQELKPIDFVPNLGQLDALIQSITILPATNTAYLLPDTLVSKFASFLPYIESDKKVADTSSRAVAQSSCLPAIFDPIAFLPDNTGLIGRTNTGICILNLETLGEESCMESPTEVVEAALSNDGQALALAFSNHTIQLSDGQLINTMEGHSNNITALKFSPTGDKLFSASHDNWVKVWDRDGNLLNSFLPGGLEVLGIGVSPDGTKLATISFEGPMKLWDISKNQIVQEFESPYGAFDGAEAAFSPDGQIVARGIGGGPITLFKVSDGTQLWSGGVYALAFSPDGRFLAISDVDEDGENIVVLRSQDGGQTHMILRGHHSIILKIIFSPDGSVIASGDDLELKIWHIEDGQLIYNRSSTCP